MKTIYLTILKRKRELRSSDADGGIKMTVGAITTR
jgi:hypothetical protein